MTYNLSPEKIFAEIKEVSEFLLHKGWAERNAGNFSIRLDFQKYSEFLKYFDYSFEIESKNETQDIDDICFLISNSGSKFREIKSNQIDNICMVKIKDNKITVFATSEKVKPSSELPSHILMQDFLNKNIPENKFIIHTHPSNIIAFSHKFNHYSNKEINDLLQSIMPEVKFFVEKELGVTGLLTPGSNELALATLQQLRKHDVILWKKHGCLCASKSLWDGIDQIDILDKAAYICLIADLKLNNNEDLC